MKFHEKVLLGAAGAAGTGAVAWRTMFPWIGHDLQLLHVGMKLNKERMAAMSSLLVDKFEKNVANHPKKPFIIFEGSVFTFEFVDQMACKAANVVKTWGVQPRDNVVIMIANEPSFIWTFLGLQKLGLAVAFINYNLKMTPLVHSIKAANSKYLIVGEGQSLLDNVLEIRSDLDGMDIYVQGLGNNLPPHGVQSFDPLMLSAHASGIDPKFRSEITLEDTCCFIYTSGTTGNPKPAIIPHHKSVGFSFGASIVDFQASDTIYIPLPLYHSAGGGLGLFGSLRTGNPKPAIIPHHKSIGISFGIATVDFQASDTIYIPLPLYHSAGGGLGVFASLRTGVARPCLIWHSKANGNSAISANVGMQSRDVLYITMPLYHSAASTAGLFGAVRIGNPKPCIIKHSKACANCSIVECVHLQPSDIFYMVLPLYHSAAGMAGLYGLIHQGNPKPCIIKHSKACANCSIVEFVHLQPSDIFYMVMPLYHSAAGATGLFGVIHQGSTIVLKRKFSASQFWPDCCKYEVTVIQYIGELFRYLLAQPPRESDSAHKVRAAFGNGLRKDIWLDVCKRFKIPLIAEFFGATEGVSLLLNIANKPGAIGRLSPFMNALDPEPKAIVKFDYASAQPIRDKDGRCVKVPLGEPGLFISKVPEVMIKNGTFAPYMSSKEANEKKLVRNAFNDGDLFFNYGDVFVQDDEYFVYFQDRIGDTFRWKGENVSTTELANVITSLNFVEDANVYGVTIPGHDGRAGMVALTLNEGCSLGEKELQQVFAHVKESLPEYSHPLFVRLLDQAVITGTFKQRKVELVKEAYDLDKIKDSLYYRDAAKKTYSPLTKNDLPKFLSSKL